MLSLFSELSSGTVIGLLTVVLILSLWIRHFLAGRNQNTLLPWLSLLMILPYLFEISGFQALVDIKIRLAMESLGWYRHRAPLQITLLLVMMLGLLFTVFLQKQTRLPRQQHTDALSWGIGLIFLISVIDLVSYHYTDLLLHAQLASLSVKHLLQGAILLHMTGSLLGEFLRDRQLIRS